MKADGIGTGNERALIAYFVLAIALSWSIAVPLALAKHGVIDPVLPVWSHYFAAYGPAVSAFIAGAALQGRPAVRELVSRTLLWKVKAKWWAVALSPLLLVLFIAVALMPFSATIFRLSDLGTVRFLPPLGPVAFLLWFFTFGLGEEIGWRGFALPRLQKGRTALPATLILTFWWALWHLPMFFYLFEPDIAAGWLIGLLAGSIVFTWLFNSSAGSCLIVAVAHASFNFTTASAKASPLLAAGVSTVVMIWAVVVVVVCRPRDLSRTPRTVFPPDVLQSGRRR